jgi:hypothetical protein
MKLVGEGIKLSNLRSCPKSSILDKSIVASNILRLGEDLDTQLVATITTNGGRP